MARTSRPIVCERAAALGVPVGFYGSAPLVRLMVDADVGLLADELSGAW